MQCSRESLQTEAAVSPKSFEVLPFELYITYSRFTGKGQKTSDPDGILLWFFHCWHSLQVLSDQTQSECKRVSARSTILDRSYGLIVHAIILAPLQRWQCSKLWDLVKINQLFFITEWQPCACLTSGANYLKLTTPRPCNKC